MTNKIDCFGVDGGEGMQIEAQSMLPDISDFELLGEELKGGQNCQKWQKIQKVDELNPEEHQPTYMLLPDWREGEQVHNLGEDVRGHGGAGPLRDEGVQLPDGKPLRSLLPLLSELQSREAC